ncbi:hypothetical protein [uncultured Bacteroides sp.]|uniref:hypothetical protein n=2 Tax=uncultured Bacteroides sp. TaxID=162156 RepID=UPI0026701293|nr:hypothetical protein [uncultured Bacteroides sp.]
MVAQSRVDTLGLNASYRKLVEEPMSVEVQKKFFTAFPDTWKSFLQTYDFCPQEDLTMYKSAHDHIVNGLGRLVTLLPDSIYCDKLIRLCIGGRWEADAPNYLQMVVRQVMHKKPEVMFQRLSMIWQGDVFSFWYFFFHSLHSTIEETNLYAELCEKMGKKYPMIVKDMEIAFSVSSGKAFSPLP